ncbi:MAG TPA: FtsQ-type POTRA domain-containing protein, partial [Vicinamibacterales bacterium]|nr:FtsQ-type POTRA domain-containing protein [Vicinamibacterales bacterium]
MSPVSPRAPRRPLVALVALAALLAAATVSSGQVPAGQGSETLAEVRVHGNHTTPDEEVLRLAGLALGQPVVAGTVENVERRLRSSGRFADVDIRKRYRSLTDLDQVALIIVVREHVVPEDPASPTPAVLRPLRRLAAGGMILPILDYTDGYGFTYGARVSFVHVLGRDGRVSVPLTWGATRRAAIEVEKRTGAGPLDRLAGGVGLWRRENPFYDLAERRSDAWVGASGRVAGPLRAAARAAVADGRFGPTEERLGSYG